MFKDIGTYISNKENDFLENSDFIIGWNCDGDIKLDGNEKLALLLSRLAYVFDIVNKEIRNDKEYDEFIDTLKGIRIKKTLEDNNITLPEIADILSKINDAKVSIIIDEDDEDSIGALIAFGKLIGLDKIGLFFKNKDFVYEDKLIYF